MDYDDADTGDLHWMVSTWIMGVVLTLCVAVATSLAVVHGGGGGAGTRVRRGLRVAVGARRHRRRYATIGRLLAPHRATDSTGTAVLVSVEPVSTPSPSPVPAQQHNDTADHVIGRYVILNRLLDWASRHRMSRVNRRCHDAVTRYVSRIAAPRAARVIQSRWRECYGYHTTMSCFGCCWRAHLRYILACLPSRVMPEGATAGDYDALRHTSRRMALGYIRRMIWCIRRYSLVQVGETVVFRDMDRRAAAVVVHLRQDDSVRWAPLDELSDRLSTHVTCTAARLLCDFHVQLAAIHRRMPAQDVEEFWAVIGD